MRRDSDPFCRHGDGACGVLPGGDLAPGGITSTAQEKRDEMGTGKPGRHRAVFLDRDGVINRNVVNPATGECESPLAVDDFEFAPGAFDAMRELQVAGFLLFLVSNQPTTPKENPAWRYSDRSMRSF